MVLNKSLFTSFLDRFRSARLRLFDIVEMADYGVSDSSNDEESKNPEIIAGTTVEKSSNDEESRSHESITETTGEKTNESKETDQEDLINQLQTSSMELQNKAEIRNEPNTTEQTTDSLQVAFESDKVTKPSSIAKLFETFMIDSAGEQFEQLQVFQQLNLCAAGEGLPRLTGLSTSEKESNQSLQEPVEFRHIQSTPIRHTPSILDYEEDVDEPPPIGPAILARSRSTPLSMSANSAFGTTLRTMTYSPADRSAFTLPPYRLKRAHSSDRVSRHSTFNPIKYDEESETEPTFIEVVDLPTHKTLKDNRVRKSSMKRAPLALAARLLSEIRNFRRRRHYRGGRENPARPPSSSDESAKSVKKTQAAYEEFFSLRPSSSSRNKPMSSSGNKEGLASRNSTSCESPLTLPSLIEESDSFPATVRDRVESRQNIESEHLQRKDEPLVTDNTSRIPSPLCHQMEGGMSTSQVGRVCIHVSYSNKEPINQTYPATSPEPSEMARDASSLTPQSGYSPGTSRCSGTTYTSGHYTQGTSTICSIGQVSHLSTISETDLEVMEVNKGGSHLQEGDGTSARCRDDSVLRSIPLSSSRKARYAALANSPLLLRDGANVPAERFFTVADSQLYERRSFGRLRTTSSSRKSSSHSPTTVSSSSMTTNTNSSFSSAGDEPPKFVSYLDRKIASDLTSLRESVEASSPRAADEERESSPAELFNTDVIFEQAHAPLNTTSKKPSPIWPTKGFQLGRRVGSLPPRSPSKGSRTPTPPLGGSDSISPVYNGLSPPRRIVDHRIDPIVSKPYVFRTTPLSTRLVQDPKIFMEALGTSVKRDIPIEGAEEGAQEVVRVNSFLPRVPSPINFRSRTYAEHNIEILKSDSKEESSPTFYPSGEVGSSEPAV